MTIIGMSKLDSYTVRCTIEFDQTRFEFSVTVTVHGTIRSYSLLNLTEKQKLLVQNSAYSRPFARCFWLYFDGKDVSFPVILSPY